MPSFQNYLKAIRSEVAETDVAALKSALAGDRPPFVIDVREQDEYAQGSIPGARWISRGYLEQRIEEKRELELHVFRRARALHLLEFSVGKRIRVV